MLTRILRGPFARTIFPVLLKTLGHPALHRADGKPVGGLRRKKDLALLVYLCVEGLPVHARGRLAGLLWGDSPDERARHSLTQAVGRLLRVLPEGVLASDKDAVRWSGGLPCDAVRLLREGMEPEEVDDAFSLYAGDFLAGFDAGPGAQDFREWADRHRAELRNAAVRLLDRAGEQAEAAGAWERAGRLSERAVKIDPLWEQGHRRIMRALAARGERNLALRHYQELEAYLEAEVGGRPDPDTRALAERLRAPDPVPSAPPPPHAPEAPPPIRAPRPEPAPGSVSEPGPGPGSGAEAGPGPEGEPEPDLTCVSAGAGPADTRVETRDGAAALADLAGVELVGPRPAVAVAGAGRRTSRWRWMALAAALAALVIAAARDRYLARAALAEPPPAHGESVRMRGSRTVFLAFGKTLYQYPDTSTLCACTGWHPEVVREVHRLPHWPRRMLPSVRDHGWLGAGLPVVSDHPRDKTAYVAVGCILPGVPDPPTLDSIFGPNALGRMQEVPDSVLSRLPRAFIARGHPLRPAGTLIRGPGGGLRWITYHGGALEVSDPALLATYCRSPDQAVSVSEREFRYYKAWGRLVPGSGTCRTPG